MKLYFNKTIGPYRKGVTKNVPDKLAKFYLKAGIAEQAYSTKILVAEKIDQAPKVLEVVNQPAEIKDEVAIEDASEQHDVEIKDEVDPYEGLDVEDLKALADLHGIKVHHKAGAEKIKEALKGVQSV